MLIMGFIGTTSDAASARALAADINQLGVGGVCFLGHNTKSKHGIEQLTRLFQDASDDTPSLIAVDQEGGAVQRLGKRNGYPAFPRARNVARQHSPEHAREIYRQLAETIKTAGFNLNLSPVLDLGIEPDNPVVYKWGRTFGVDGDTVAKYAGAFIEAHRELNILTAVKHFPGHGSTRVDSHARPVDITDTWQADELTPFKRLIDEQKIDIVMSGHLSHDKLTGGMPATLSANAVKLLRENLAYEGVLMTDDLDMKAIRSSYSLIDAVLRSIEAGYDLILLSNSLTPDRNLAARIVSAVSDAVKNGRLSADSIHESAERVQRLRVSISRSAV